MKIHLRAAVRGRLPAHRPFLALMAATALLTVGCATGSSPGATAGPGATGSGPSEAAPVDDAPTGSITLYTSVTQPTVDAILESYKARAPGVTVEVFRAPTGELASRIAADLRTGKIGADVLWPTDPLSIGGYADKSLLRKWQPVEAATIADAYHTDTYWGTRFLNMVMIRGKDVTPGPLAWKDLTDPAYKDAVGIPDPAFAGSALGALAYFAEADGLGMDFYKSLKANGAVQVKSPVEVTSGVAEGRFKAGVTIDQSAREAIKKGSPIELVWPSDGAIAIYTPIGVVGESANPLAAESLVEFILSEPGQKAIGSVGFQPIREGAGGPPPDGTQVAPDWSVALGRQADLLAEYQAIFGD